MADEQGRHTGLPGQRTIRFGLRSGRDQAVAALKALGHEARLDILDYLTDRPVASSQIARHLGLPISTANMHIGVLEKAGLIQTEMRAATRGLQKMCARPYDEIALDLPPASEAFGGIRLSMPIGGYSDASTEPTCGLASISGLIGLIDDPTSFFEPDHIAAQLIWFRVGHLEYRFPNRLPPSAKLTGIQLSAEVCSEAPDYDPEWPSDIAIWINGRHLGDWTCPGDFGGRRGRLTPDWWQAGTMFGLLKQWRVTREGTTIDGLTLSEVTIDEVGIKPGQPIVVRIGVRPDARHVGGINLFGRGFGNYPQDIELRLEYDPDAS